MNLSRQIDNFFIGARSAWLAKSRGLAVFSGVLLSTVVLSAILSYSNALGQVAMQESIKDVLYDALITFKNEPGFQTESRTNSITQFSSICNTLQSKPEILDCSLVFFRQGIYPHLYDNQWEAQEKGIKNILADIYDTDTTAPERTDISWNKLLILGSDAIDGQLGEAYSSKIVDGAWFDSARDKEVVLPLEEASKINVRVGDKVNMTLSFVNDTYAEGKVGECKSLHENLGRSFIETDDSGSVHCRQTTYLEEMSVIGIYQAADVDGIDIDMELQSRIIVNTNALRNHLVDDLMATDHGALALKIDRSLIPSTVGDAKKWLIDLEDSIQGTASNPVKYSNIEITYSDEIRDLLSGLTWFIVFIRIFDYVLMIPVILLSLSVLIYGLNLALEQRRAEVAIHRTYGGTSKALLGLILSEVFLVSIVAWLAGYFIGIFSANFIIDAVGFMEFESNEYDLRFGISRISAAVIFCITVGLAMIIAWSKTKRFLSMEIEEAILKESKPKTNTILLLINITLFAIGLTALTVSMFKPDLNFTNGTLYIIGPFALWIGGSIILAKISGFGPKFVAVLLGKTPILSDVIIGIRSSGLNRSMNQLGLIVILTISIVTMAVFQGYTGSLVDKRSASASSGADIQIIFSQPVSQLSVETLLKSSINKTKLSETLQPSGFSSMYRDRFGVHGQRQGIEVVVLSANHRNVLHWQDQTVQNGLDSLLELPTLGFTSGVEAAKKLDLAARPDTGFINLGSPFEDFDYNDSGFDSIALTYPYDTNNPQVVSINYIGGHRWVPGAPQGIQADEVIIIEESTFRSLNNNNDYLASYWFVELCDENNSKCRKGLGELNSHLSNDVSVVSVRDWATQYDEVSRMGGLIFGTPGILSLQYIVATFATLASSMVFLSLILTRRKRELAILQSIGASAGQLSRLVIFEIISVFTFSLILGGLLGLGLAQTFTGLFSMFGAAFQYILQSQVLIARELVWPWPQVLLVNGLVFVLVWVALMATTLRAIRSDLPTVLKEE